MWIVAINGSPNKEGNTAYLLQKVLDSAKAHGAKHCFLYHAHALLSELKNPFCNVCSNPCSGICYKGSRLEEVFDTMKQADALVFGSPTYFGTVSAQLKAFFDKTRKLRGEKAFYNKLACGLSVGKSPYGGQETTLRALHDMMLVHGMQVVGDGSGMDDCGHSGVCATQPSWEDAHALKRAEILGKRLVGK
jgi:multimeric flavodoxin WrbA